MTRKRPGLDGRHRDSAGRISEKHGNTRVGTLRESYGPDFASGHRSDMKLSTLLDREGVESLSQYLTGVKLKDGVRILKPRGTATHFTEKEVRDAVASARAAKR